MCLCFRSSRLRRAGHDEHEFRRRVRVLHGRLRAAAGVPVLVGVHPGAEAVADGHHQSQLRAVHGGGVCWRLRAADAVHEAGRHSRNS